jgi:arylsulfatase A-like enzyme
MSFRASGTLQSGHRSPHLNSANITRRRFLTGAAGAGILRAAPLRPNIIFILADDLGYGDLGITGNRDVPTPNLDSLAHDGVRFTQFYDAAPICSPSRVGITTGQFPSRHLIHSYLSDRKSNRALGMRDWLDPSAPCIARSFQQAGYATGHFGKWHMGGGRDVGEAPLPQAYGFDESVTSFEGLGDRILGQEDGDLSKQSAALGTGKIQWAHKYEQTGLYVDRAVDFIRRNKAKPFYVHLWPCDVHDFHYPHPDLMGRYARFSRNPYQQKFYAVLDEFDRQIGRLLGALEDLGAASNTIVAFTSDNGPTAWPRYYREGFEPPGSTAGFRGRKWSLYEGGIRQPLLVRWKGRIPAGRVDETSVVSAVDLFQTFCSLASVRPPPVAFDGVDMSAAFRGKPHSRRPPLLWEYDRGAAYPRPGNPADVSPNLAIRDGRWKLLVKDDGSAAELYDFSQSQLEREDMAAAHPEVVRRLRRQVLEWRRSLPELNRKTSNATH